MRDAPDFASFCRDVRESAETFLERAFDACPDTTVCRAARYATMRGGHRWRAIATIAAGRACHADALDLCLPVACATELAHTASLVLDDLPSMDDATLRRGKPCVHLAYPRWAVDMAPVFLVTMAFGMALDNPLVPGERRLSAAIRLSRAGLRMARGQEGDVTQPLEGSSEELLVERYSLKTGALFAVAAENGVLLCGAGSAEAEAFRDSGMALGVAYQIADDVADRTSEAVAVAKSVNRDHSKVTSVDLFGLEGARLRAERYREIALRHLVPYGLEAGLFRSLISEASCVDRPNISDDLRGGNGE